MVSKAFIDQEFLYEEQDASGESEDDLTGVTAALLSNAVVWGTDWTAATIVDQMRRGAISLYPAFQRRDAWTDDRKSRFIESLILGLPIPQLVLAESNTARGKFIVIDGKQRLLSLSKFTGIGLAEDQDPLILTGLKIRTDLNRLTYSQIKSNIKYDELVSDFDNQAIRTVVIRGWKHEEVLYTIFHRLNSGSVPLSAQELRQALHPGPFLSFAAKFSEQSATLKELFGLTKPDFRMRDVELVIRFFAFYFFADEYRGTLKQFLDDTCDKLNKRWPSEEAQLRAVAAQLDEAIKTAIKIFTRTHVFRKWDGTRFEKPFNRAIFDVVASSLTDETTRAVAIKEKAAVLKSFKELCLNEDFRNAIGSTTKSKTAVRTRFSKWYKTLSQATGRNLTPSLPEE